MRKAILLVALAAVLALVVAGAVSLSRLRTGVETALDRARVELAERAGLELTGARTELRLLPPAVVVEGAAISTSKSGRVPVAEGGSLRIVPRLAPLLAGRAEVERIEAEGVRLIVRPDPATSATALAALAAESTAPLALRDGVVVLDRAQQPYEVSDVDLDVTARDGAVDLRGTMALLGPGSNADVQAVWRPGAGKTGGDGLEVDIRLRDGEREALAALLPDVRADRVTGPISLDLTAEGFFGERSTETAPAPPLAGTLRGEAPLDLFGREQLAVFQSDFSIDDRRYTLGKGKGTWGERPFEFSGWVARGLAPHKVGLRLMLDGVDVASVLADYGIEERWRPEATVTGQIRMGGTFSYPLTRYEARIPSARFDGWPSVPIVAGPTTVRGMLASINADVSASFDVDELKVAHVTIPEPLLGLRWWRDKLTVSSLGMKLWDGKLDGGIGYEPAAGKGVEGGAMLTDADASLVADQFFGEEGLDVEGRLDGTLQGIFDDGKLAYEGFLGLHRGASGPPGFVRAIVAQAAGAVGGANAVGDALADEYGVLASGLVPFERAEAAYERRGDDLVVTVRDVESDGATMSGNVTRGPNGRLSGDVAVKLEPALVSALSAYVGAFAKLAAEDGSVSIPARVDGTIADLEVKVDPGFVTALENAHAGGQAAAYAPPEFVPLVELEQQAVREQFGR